MGWFWALLSVILVLGLRLFTVYKIRNLKARLFTDTAELKNLHADLTKLREEIKMGKKEEEKVQSNVKHLKEVVYNMKVKIDQAMVNKKTGKALLINESEKIFN